ncbi:type IV-A pilus assembly ATPase PilB [Vibrio ostreicida]|uniref:type IV-A pilus assembly ATPase PilB n=1 Tax=Vibrio ostreicida TaxID=526588 RepID=UPI003B58D3B4
MSELPSILCRANVINSDQEASLNTSIQTQGINAPIAIIEMGLFTSHSLADQLSKLFGLSLVQLDQFDYEACCNTLGLGDMVHYWVALPLQKTENMLTLAVADPSDLTVEEEFRFATGVKITRVIVDIVSLMAAIRQLYGVDRGFSYQGKDINEEELAQLVELSTEETLTGEMLSEEQAPISRYIRQVLFHAVAKQASDVHFEPYEASFRVRFRCDGLLIEVNNPPYHLGQRLVARLKVLSKLNITERRLPQDGRMKISLGENNAIDMRVSTMPTLWGEKVVLRLLDNQNIGLDLNSLGLNKIQSELYQEALRKPQGLILITGPTGSGKTLSLYSGLDTINNSNINIITAEDPIEINLHGVNQAQIQPQIGFSFAQALRSFLRQDPDVIMVGEIRDGETADIATKAAQTGHLVLSTLHTNTAVESIIRLKNMGVEAFNLASSLNLVVAQRLARRLCPMCKRLSTLPVSIQTSVSGPALTEHFEAYPKGCHHCNNGYLGRVGLYEVIKITPEITHLILEDANIQQLESAAIEQGMQTLEQSGIEKLSQGIISYAELQRVLLT